MVNGAGVVVVYVPYTIGGVQRAVMHTDPSASSKLYIRIHHRARPSRAARHLPNSRRCATPPGTVHGLSGKAEFRRSRGTFFRWPGLGPAQYDVICGRLRGRKGCIRLHARWLAGMVRVLEIPMVGQLNPRFSEDLRPNPGRSMWGEDNVYGCALYVRKLCAPGMAELFTPPSRGSPASAILHLYISRFTLFTPSPRSMHISHRRLCIWLGHPTHTPKPEA